MPGIEPGPFAFARETVRPPGIEVHRSTSAHQSWGDQPDLHRHKRRHRA